MPLALSLFSGCGGCSLGLIEAGFEIVLAADINGDACRTYETNLRHHNVWNTNLADIQPNVILERAHINHNQIDIIVGGPPCQGFSSAGARDWDDPRNAMIKKFVEIVVTLKPTWFIMENVEGLLTAKDGFFIIEAISRFLEAGYWVKAEKIYLEKYGVPQKRKRVILVGNLEANEFTFPEPTHTAMQPNMFDDTRPLHIMDAISDLPAPTLDGVITYNEEPHNEYQMMLRRADEKPVWHHQMRGLNAVNRERISNLRQGETMKNLPSHLQHPSFTKRANRRVMDGTPTEKRGGAPSGMKRLADYEPSLTITSAAPSEFIHPLENRLLTLRECARIQSFPDWFEFYGKWASVATQIGNAIPPMFIAKLAQHIANSATWRQQDHAGRWLGMKATKSTGMSPALIKMLQELERKTLCYAR